MDSKHFNGAAGTYYVAVEDASAIGMPIAYHLGLNFKPSKAPKSAVTTGGVPTGTISAGKPTGSAPTPVTPVTPVQTTPPATGASDAGSQDGDVLVKYTYYGDANLDSAIDQSDYTNIDQGFNPTSTGLQNVDPNYAAFIAGLDYTLITNAFTNPGSSLTPPLAVIPTQG